MKHIRILSSILGAGALALIGLQTPAFAQSNTAQTPGTDLSGNWSAVNSTDANMDMPGAEPGPVDFLGVPLNDASRKAAEMYSLDEISVPELQCAYYPPFYVLLGPFGLRIDPQYEMHDGRVVAWVVGGWEDIHPITIWVDGRPQPSDIAPHGTGGFATGVWQDDALVAHVTHMRRGIARRNGTPLSDNADLTLYFFRHNDELTVVGRMTDPVYLTQPQLMARTFRHFLAGPQAEVGFPCVISNEGALSSQVSYFLPGHNPFMTETSRIYGIPQDAVLGGAKTMYPDYRNFLKDKYKRPASCPSREANPFSETVCGGPGTYAPRP